MRKITFVRLDCRVSTLCHYVLNFLFTIKLWEIQRFVVDRDFWRTLQAYITVRKEIRKSGVSDIRMHRLQL